MRSFNTSFKLSDKSIFDKTRLIMTIQINALEEQTTVDIPRYSNLYDLSLAKTILYSTDSFLVDYR